MANEWTTVAKARTDFADLLDTLSENQLATPSLCDQWTVRDVAGHLVNLVEVSIVGMAIGTVKKGMDVDAYLASAALDFSAKGQQVLSRSLRDHASKKLPFYSEASMVADTAVHTQDVRRPLGLTDPLDPEVLAMSLDHSVDVFAKMAKKKGRATPTFVATDMNWSKGDGPSVEGTGEALLMALNYRGVSSELTGDGKSLLSKRA